MVQPESNERTQMVSIQSDEMEREIFHFMNVVVQNSQKHPGMVDQKVNFIDDSTNIAFSEHFVKVGTMVIQHSVRPKMVGMRTDLRLD